MKMVDFSVVKLFLFYFILFLSLFATFFSVILVLFINYYSMYKYFELAFIFIFNFNFSLSNINFVVCVYFPFFIFLPNVLINFN